MSTQTTTIGSYIHTIEYVTAALGDFAADFDVKAIAHEIFDYTPGQQGHYTLNVDEDTFWSIVAAHEVAA